VLVQAQRRRSLFQDTAGSSQDQDALALNRRQSAGQGKENTFEEDGDDDIELGDNQKVVEIELPRSNSRRCSIGISYKEPLLNTKLRKGHVFFPKSDTPFKGASGSTKKSAAERDMSY